MQLMVTTPDGSVFPVDVPQEMPLVDFFSFCRAESRFLSDLPASSNLEVFHDGKVYSNLQSTLLQVGLKDGELIMIRPCRVQKPPTDATGSTSNNDMQNLIKGKMCFYSDSLHSAC